MAQSRINPDDSHAAPCPFFVNRALARNKNIGQHSLFFALKNATSRLETGVTAQILWPRPGGNVRFGPFKVAS